MLLERTSPVPSSELQLAIATANAIAEKHNALLRNLGATEIGFGVQGSRYEAVRRAVTAYPPADLAKALDVAAFVAERKQQPQILDARVWVGYRGGPAEFESWLETSLAEEQRKLERRDKPKGTHSSHRIEPGPPEAFTGEKIKL